MATLIAIRGIDPSLRGLQWESAHRLRIGQHEDQEIVLSHPSVDQQHAEIVPFADGWAIRDLGSSKGTFLNGVQLEWSEQKLELHDVVQCGDLALQIAQMGGDVPEPSHTPGGPPAILAIAERSWQEGLQALALADPQLAGQATHALALLRAGYHLCHLSTLDKLLRSILDDAVVVFNAQRGAIILADERTGQLRMCTASLRTKGSIWFSGTLVHRSFSLGQSVLCSDVHAHPDLEKAGSVRRGNMASIICALLRTPVRPLGVMHLDRGPGQDCFTQDDLFLADAIAAQVSIGVDSALLMRKQRETFVQTVAAMSQAVELRDLYTGNHTHRVTRYALMLADEFDLPLEQRRQIEVGTALHDIGKIGISDAILHKPGRLTHEEFESMKTHVTKGAAMLQHIPDLEMVLPMVRNHHERWDGTGYPDGLAGVDIPLLARIVGVVDAFDAMTSDRPYRRALLVGQAFAELERNAGKHFDPACVAAFVRVRPHVEAILGEQVARP